MLHSLDVATEFPSIQDITALICEFRIASNVRLKSHFSPVSKPFSSEISPLSYRPTSDEPATISYKRDSQPRYGLGVGVSNNTESLDKCLHGLSTKDSDVGNPAPRTVAGHGNFTSRTARNSAREVTSKRFVHKTLLNVHIF